MSIKAQRLELLRQYRIAFPCLRPAETARSLKAEFDAVTDNPDEEDPVEPDFLSIKKSNPLSYRQYISSFS